MVRKFAAMGLAVLLLAGWASQAAAQGTSNPPQGMWHNRLEALTAKLNLNKQQQAAIQKIFAEFDEKTDRLDRQLWSLHQQECDALTKMLTDEQRTKLPAVLKQEREIEWTAIATKLGLTVEERERIKTICEKFEPRFESIVHQKGDEAFKQLHDLRHEIVATIQKELTTEQRVKFPGIMREEFHQWHDPATRGKHLDGIGDKLGLNENQREQARTIIANFDQQFSAPAAQLRQLHADERMALEKLLSEEQRTKLRELLKTSGL